MAETGGTKILRFNTIITIFILISLMFFSQLVFADDAELDIEFDQFQIEYIIGPNCTYVENIGGWVKCEFNDLNDEIFQVEVDLEASDQMNWSPVIGPEHMTFQTSGVKRFNVSVSIPTDIYNNTENQVFARGSWVTKPYSGSLVGGYGNFGPDICVIKIDRRIPIGGEKIIIPEYPEYEEFYEEWSLEEKLIFSLIPILIIIIVIVVYFYRKFHNEE